VKLRKTSKFLVQNITQISRISINNKYIQHNSKKIQQSEKKSVRRNGGYKFLSLNCVTVDFFSNSYFKENWSFAKDACE
jgi:hypothetical protein